MEIYDRVVASTLCIKVQTHSGDRYVGAAFLVGDSSRAVTAWHVIMDAAEISGTYSDGSTATIQGVIGRHEVHDLALLRVAPTDREPLSLNLGTPRIASRVYAIGSPRGYAFSISDGLLSQVQTIDGFPQYQLTCPFSPGNSGGPVVNSLGEVIGVASWSKIGAQNLNFAIPSSFVSQFVFGTQPTSGRPVSNPIVETRPRGTPDPTQILTAASGETSNGPDPLDPFRELLRSFEGKTVQITVSSDDRSRSIQYPVPSRTSVTTHSRIVSPGESVTRSSHPEASLAE